jgi:WS/DGAT/MGAT family acyltransferase
MEDANTPMHVSGFSIYELAPLQSERGGVDFELFGKAIESALPRIPRYRQRLAYTPIEGRPVWVDAEGFDLADHLHHLSLPPPGTAAQLKELVGWIVSQPLDHRRPLWEMWVVEGIDGAKQFAVVTKMHHCMIDGGAGVNLMQILLRTSPEVELTEPEPFVPLPVPSPLELARYEVGRRVGTPLRLLGGLRDLIAEGPNLLAKLRQNIGAFGELMENMLPAARTPISRMPLGSRRRVDWLEVPLDELARLRRRLDVTLNDLVLAIVAGALRRYLTRRGVPLEGLDFRVSIPVNVRVESEKDEPMGNRISSWIIPMPLDEPDPLDQLEMISRRTGELKDSRQAIAVEMLMAAADEVPALLSLNTMAMQGQISMIVTNVPGPQIPLYMLGCRALSMQPLVPLVPGVGIGVALLSYNGTVFWGFQADYDLVPDLELFVEDVVAAQCALEREVAPSTQESSQAGRRKAEERRGHVPLQLRTTE